MTQLLPPGAPEFRERFSNFRDSVFRLETLQIYSEPGEHEGLAAFLAGEPEPADPDHDAWCAQIAANVAFGKAVQRVHLITEPLTAYMRYELTWGYAPNVRAGEDIRIIEVAVGKCWPHNIPQYDFWLFDDTDLYRMYYDAGGVWVGVECIADRATIRAACAVKREALHLGVPWVVYLSERPELSHHLTLARS